MILCMLTALSRVNSAVLVSMIRCMLCFMRLNTSGYLNCNVLCAVMDPVSLPDPTVVFSSSSLDKAMLNTFNGTRLFVMNAFNLTEDQAITAITVFSDFSVSQVCTLH